MSAYGAFAALYDRLMDDVDYDGWADWYLQLLNAAGVAPKKLCDCACGTGSMSVRFARRGIQVTGADLSGEMLARAQEKARGFGVQVMFVAQDMCALTLPRPVDALVCACDGVNYLTDLKQVKACFAHVFEALRPGGRFAFDISAPAKLNGMAGQMYGEDREDVTYLWMNERNDERNTLEMNLAFFVKQDGGLYKRFSERHVQRIHQPEELIALLEQAGFTDISAYSGMTLEPCTARDERIHFIAHKPQ